MNEKLLVQLLEKIESMSKDIEELKRSRDLYLTEVPKELEGTPFDNLEFLNAILSGHSGFSYLKKEFNIDLSDEVLREYLDRRYGETWKTSILRTIGHKVPEPSIPEILKAVPKEELLDRVVVRGFTSTRHWVTELCEEADEPCYNSNVLGLHLEGLLGKPKPANVTWPTYCRDYLNSIGYYKPYDPF